MVVFAKKGSALVKQKREQAERAKATTKLASLGGMPFGNVMGVRDDEADADGACACFPLCARAAWHRLFT